MFEKRLLSFKYAFKGIITLIKSQANAKIHLFATILVVLCSFLFQVSAIEWCMLIICIAAVFSAEAFNTALEFLTDLVSPEYHPLAGKVKDVAAAGVLIVAIGSFIVAVIIFLPKLIQLIIHIFMDSPT